MPEYLAPGVHVEELPNGPRPIEGVSTHTAAFLGETVRGPTEPRLVTNYAEYVRLYGSLLQAGRYLPHTVHSFFANGGQRCYVARVASADATAASAELGAGVAARALGPGSSGNRIFVRLDESTTAGPGFRLQVCCWDDPAVEPFDAFAATGTNPRPDYAEDFDDLSLDASSSAYFGARVNGTSRLIEVDIAEDATLPPNATGKALAGGTDGGGVTAADYAGDYAGDATDPHNPRGLVALEGSRLADIAIVYAPNATLDVAKKVIAHCEADRYRFAVIDAPAGQAEPANLDPRATDGLATKYAAYYYPWIEVSAPNTNDRVLIPPGGAVCGIYARTDNNRGVWKAPANELVRDAVGLEFDVNGAVQDVLNPKGVNVIRQFAGMGIRVWGARTLSTDALWKYVNVRRLFLFLEASIDRGTQWAVFEPNDAPLWTQVKQSITQFLRNLWRDGALVGAKEEEAFVVAVGRGQTMTEDDIDNGRLIVEIGIAPVHPAEFVIFRIIQKTREAQD